MKLFEEKRMMQKLVNRNEAVMRFEKMTKFEVIMSLS